MVKVNIGVGKDTSAKKTVDRIFMLNISGFSHIFMWILVKVH